MTTLATISHHAGTHSPRRWHAFLANGMCSFEWNQCHRLTVGQEPQVCKLCRELATRGLGGLDIGYSLRRVALIINYK